jgi:DNA-binding PadR family transcriptional regulator
MIENFEQGLTAIMKTFPPSSSLHFGENHYRIISGVLDLGKKKESFSTAELVKYVNEYPVWRDKPVEAKEVRNVLEKLERENLVIKQLKETYKISSLALESLGEFFSLHWRPRGGRTGFMSYLLQSKHRTIQWCCIYSASKVINPTELSKLSDLDLNTCKMFLERLARRNQLKRIGRYRYIVIEEKILRDLMFGYQRYRYTKPTIKDNILEIMLDHEKMSGKEICEHLNKFGINCHPTTVYTHLRNLEEQKILRKAGRVRRRAIDEIYYALNYEDVESYKKELLQQIREAFNKVGINVKDGFFVNAIKQDPHSLRVFLKQLMNCITAHDEHEDASYDLWRALASSLLEKDFPIVVSKFLLIKSKEERERELRTLVKQHNISPALLSMLLLFQSIKAKLHMNSANSGT